MTVVWLAACVLCFCAGEERQRQSGMHIQPTRIEPQPDEYDYRVIVSRNKLDREKVMTTVAWGDGRRITVEGGQFPQWLPDDVVEMSFPGRATTEKEKRQSEQDYLLPRGVLDRWSETVQIGS